MSREGHDYFGLSVSSMPGKMTEEQRRRVVLKIHETIIEIMNEPL